MKLAKNTNFFIISLSLYAFSCFFWFICIFQCLWKIVHGCFWQEEIVASPFKVSNETLMRKHKGIIECCTLGEGQFHIWYRSMNQVAKSVSSQKLPCNLGILSRGNMTNNMNNGFYGGTAPLDLFFRLCVFSPKNKATSDKVLNRSD